jgi:signal transduction histidine kinase/DNA-binding response OmpR family regulator
MMATWDTDAGSPFLAITAMAQTPDGYLWLGSYEGLARFDGVRFEHQSEAVFPLKDILVLSMAVDPEGALWVGTSQGIWRRRDRTWEQFTPAQGLVYSIAIDSRGDIVALVGREVVQWNGTDFELLPRIPNHTKTLSQTICFFDGEDRLWISGRRFLYYRENNAWHALRHLEAEVPDSPLLGAGPARDGGIWFAEGTVLQRYDDGAIVETIPRIAEHQLDEVSLWEDESGNLWEAGERNGLVIHTADGTALSCTVDEGLSNNALIAIAPDNEGNVWLGSDGGGVTRVRPRSLITHANRSQLSQAVINTVVELSPNRLLVGTHGGGALVFENGAFGNPIHTGGFRGVDGQSWVHVADVDDEGGLWIGTYQNGLHYLRDDEHRRWGFGQLKATHVYALHRDDTGRLWIGTEKNLSIMKDDRIVLQGEAGIPWGVINMIESDSAGQVWISNRKGKLWRWDGGTFRRINTVGDHEVGQVRFLHRDESGQLWITTDRNTVLREFGGNWVSYGGRQGLPTGEWKPIAADDEGYRWFGSDRGVMRVTRESLDAVVRDDTNRLHCQVLNHIDGMNSPRVRNNFQQIGERSRDGRIWITTVKGLVELNPAGVQISRQTPHIHIEQVRDGPRSLKSMIEPDDVITIPAGTKRVNIRYTGTSASYGRFLTYTYLLEGVDGDWVQAGNEPVARLTDLQPGEYVFRVRTIGLESQEEDEATVTLIVQPFWWQRWDTRLAGLFLFALFIATGIAWAMRTRYRRQRERLEQERALAQEQLRANEAKKEVEVATAASHAKSKFLATMSHEIRTPLNGVIGSMDLLLETPLTKEQRGHMATLGASAETLLTVLNDILDFSKIEAGKVSIEQAPFNLADTLREVIEVVVPRALAKGVELALIIPPEVPVLLEGDATRLRQVLINLVGNSVKFTEKGSVAVSVEAVDYDPAQTPQDAVLRFSVRDTGVGIAASRLGRLVDSFTQADASTTRKYGGTGLGLAISKHLVELMGGTIDVSSELGQGSEFYFSIPLANAILSPPARIKLRGDVTVLDDTPDVLRAEISLLTRHGISARGTASPAEALAWLQETRQTGGEQTTYLLLDESCADILTDEQTRWLNETAEQQQVNIVMLSPRPSHRPAVPPFPIISTLRKPLLDPEALRESLLTTSEEESVPAANNHAAPDGIEAQKFDASVLLVDDEPVNRIVLGKLLKRLGCTVDCAENGVEAVRLAQTNTYGLIFMDCRMPVMDGYSATTEVRNTVENAPPIIAITANTTLEDREHCIQVGMVDFVCKPVRRAELTRVLNRWL